MEGTTTIYEKLSKVQAELKAPKGQYNTFGKYNYRSCEDILEAAKPVCAKHGLVFTLSDDVIAVGTRVYIKATLIITDTANGEFVTATAYAREPEEKKGMDAAQVTGTSSSYARKYCLSGAFALDDTKDADTNEHRQHMQAAEAKEKAAKARTQAQAKPAERLDGMTDRVADLRQKLQAEGISEETVLNLYKVVSIDGMTATQLENAAKHLKDIKAMQDKAKGDKA